MKFQSSISFVFKFALFNALMSCLFLLAGCGIKVRQNKAKDFTLNIKGSLPTAWVAGVPLSSGLTVELASPKLKAGQLNGIKGSVQLSLHSDASCLGDAFQANAYQITPLAGVTEASLQNAEAVFPSFAINLASTSNNGNPIYLKARVLSSFFENSSSVFYCSPAIRVTPGVLSKLWSSLKVVDLPISSPVAAGSPMTLILTLLDTYGNPSPTGVSTPSFSYASLGAAGIFGNVAQDNNATLKPYQVVFTPTQGGSLQKFTAVSGSQSFVLNLNPSLVVQGNYGARLVVTTEPVNSNLLTPLPNVVVKLQDSQSNLISSGYDVSQGTPITVSLLSGSGGFTSGSTLSVPLIGGIATFSNLAFTTAGTKILAFTKSNTSSSGGFSALQVESAPFVISSQVFPTPQNLAATPSTSGSSSVVQLSWMASSATAGPPTYSVYRGTTPDGQSATPILSSISCTPSASCSALDLSVTAGVTYYYKVVASSAYGQSLPSNEAVAKPIGSFAIAIAQGAPASSTAGNMVITLSPAALPVGASTYGIQYASSPTFSSPSPITFCSSTDALTGCTFSAPTGLVAGQSYYFRMVATNAYNGLQYSDNTPSAIVLGLPSAPTLTSSTVSSTSFSDIHETYGISWDAVAGASGYILHWGTSSGVYTSQTTTASTSATVSGLNLGTPHYFSVSAVSSTGNLDSGELLVNPPSAPQGPFQLNALSNLNTLTWSPSSTIGVQYKIWRSSGGAAFTFLQTVNSSACVAGTCSTTDSISPGTQYTYALFAVNASNVASDMLTGSNESIGSFSVVATLAGTGAINISVPVAPIGATAYSINISTTSDMSTPISASPVTCSPAAITSTGCSISSLTVGSMAYFTVTASNTNSSATEPSSGSVSAWVQATPVIATASVAPNTSNLAQENVTLNWTPAANTNYAIHWGSTPGGPYPSTSGTVAYSAGQAVISSIPLGASYYFVLQASNTTSDASGILASSELAMVPPSPIPAFTSLSSVPGSVSLNWSGPSSGVTYNLWRSLNSGSFTLIQTGILTSPYQDSSVTNGSNYTYVVQAESSSGLTNSTVSSASVPVGNFSTVTLAQGSSSDATSTTGSIVLTAAAVTGATGYSVDYLPSTSGSTSSCTTTGVCTVLGLTAGTAYTFTLTASNGTGSSATSSSYAGTPIAIPSLSGSVALDTQALQALTINSTLQSAGADYTLAYGTSSGGPYTTGTVSAPTATTNFNLSTSNEAYYFILTATNSSGNLASGTLTSSQLSMVSPSPAPVISSVTSSGSGNTIHWTAPTAPSSGITYAVWYSTNSGSTYSLRQSGITATTFNDASAIAGTSYQYIVQAIMTTGIRSSVASSSIQTIGTFSTITITQGASSDATASLGSLVITPAAITGATTYAVSSITPATGGSSSNCLSNVCTVTGLTAGTTYTFTLTASNASGALVTSSSTSSVIPLGLPLIASSSAVANPSTPQTSETLTLNWATQNGATLYTLFWGTDGLTFPNTISSISPTATTTSYNFSGTVGTSYYFKIRAVSNSGATGSVDNTTVYSMIPPSVPLSLQATPTAPSSVQLSFSSSASLGSGSGIQYNIWRRANGGSFSQLGQASANAYTDSSISSGITYGYFVQAQTSAGISTATSIISPAVLGTVSQLVFTTQPSSGTNAGATMSAVVVTAQDAYSNAMPSYSTAIALSLPPSVGVGNPTGTTLSGTTSRTPSSGVATFNNLSIQYGGTGYQLIASSGGLNSITSNNFNINQVAFSTPIAFNSASNFTFSNANLTIGSGPTNTSETNAYLVSSNQTDQNNSSTTGFGGATLTGAVQWDSTNSYMRLGNANSSNLEHDSSWTPSWSNIVGYWKFNENAGAGSIADSSPVGTNSGTITGGVTQGITGVMGKGITFNGSTGYVTTANTFTNPQNFTYAGWFKKTSGTGGLIMTLASLTGPWAGYCDRLVFMNDAGNVFFWINGGNSLAISPLTYKDGYWHHFAATLSSTFGMSLYIDGSLVATNAQNVAAYYSGSVYIGYFPGLNLDAVTGGISSYYFSGSLDDVAVWSTALSAGAIAAIYRHQASKYTGTITSRVMDGFSASQPWTSLAWVSTLPFFKRLPPNGSYETPSAYPSAPSTSVMSGNLGLWPLNEASGASSVIDYSGNSNTGTPTSVVFGSQGNLGTSASFNGTSSQVIASSLGVKSVSFWMKVPTAKQMGLFSASTIIENNKDFSGYVFIPSGVAGGPPSIVSSSHGVSLVFFGNDVAVPYNNIANGWHHIAFSWNGGTTVLIGVDGSFPQGYLWNGLSWSSVQSQPFTLAGGTPTPQTSITGLKIGARISYFNGLIGDFSTWSRALTMSEILHLYRRQANRIFYQVQTCSEPTCTSGASGWVGSTGNDQNNFSEANNVNGSGAILTSLPLMSLTQSAFSSLTSAVYPSNRYFRYRAILETDDQNNLCTYGGSSLPCSPELMSVSVGPTHYDATSPTLVTNTGFTYSTLSNFTENLGAGGCSGGILYNLGSSSSGPWNWWNGSSWTTSNGTSAQANSASVVNANLGSYTSYSNLFIKVFLGSTGTSLCEINSLNIQGSR